MADKEATLLLKIKSMGEETLDKVSSSFDTIKMAGLAAFGALSAAIIKGVSEYGQQEQAVNSLTRAMVNNGVYSKELKTAYLDQADALSKVTLFGDEQIIAAQSAFTQQAKNLTLTKEQTRAILDFAQAQGMDAAQAAEVVGKSVGTANNALSRYGIEVNSAASSSQKLDQVMAGLNSKFGGQAEAATGGLGAVQLLSKSFGELFESLGQKVAPAVIFVAKELQNLVNNSPAVDTFISGIATGFNYITKLAMQVGQGMNVLGTIVGGVLGTVAGSISLLVDGEFSKAKDALVSGTSDLYSQLTQMEQEFQAKMKAFDEQTTATKQESMLNEEQMLKDSLARKQEIKAQDAAIQLEKDLQNQIAESEIKSANELALMSGVESQKYAAQVAEYDKRYELAKTQSEKNIALQNKYAATEKLLEAKKNEELVKNRKDTFATIATLQNSSNSVLAGIGKAAALTQIAIDTPVAVGKALAAFPPPFNFAAAGLVGAAMAAQAAKVAGIPLAEGGIVMPRPGGTQAIIGEAGQAEAVIPLDRASEFGLGGGRNQIIIQVNGGLLGDESQAREFAIVLDRELLKLRRNNESVSFDSGVL